MSFNYTNQSGTIKSDAPPPYSPSTADYYAKTSASTHDNDEKNNQQQQPQSPPLSRENKFLDIISRHEISHEYANRLQQLTGFKIVFVFDDSGSMNTTLQDSPLNTNNALFRATRWDELQYFATISIDIAALFDPAGSDVYFLNRAARPVRNVRDLSQLRHLFRERPNGFTPLSRVLATVLDDNRPSRLGERRLLVVIATDGEPTNDHGKVNIGEFKRTLMTRDPRVFTTIVACTDDEDSVRYLNKWDRKMAKLDVVDDYRSERNEVKRVKGPNYRFTFGDYVVKSLIGAVDPELDRMDEHKCAVL